MIPISRVATTTIALPFFLFVSTSAWAANTILSGMFDGAEPAIQALHKYGCAQEPLGYVQTTFRASTGGIYEVWDAFESLHRHGGTPVFFRVYKGSFNPAMPEQNSVGRVPADSYMLDAGVSYVLVVQRLCENVEGAWAMKFVGPGTIMSDAVAAVPNFTSGKFKAGDPTMPGNPWSANHTRYHQSGPIRVQRDGTYYFADMLLGAQVAVRIYTAPVNPEHPEVNQVAFATYGIHLIELQAGQDYYFVTQWIAGNGVGEYLYVLAPPAPFRINPGVTGIWHNPDTPGQGFFLTAYEKINQVFLAWFTYANESSAGNESGHQWMTAFGNFEGAAAELAIEWTVGGRFDAPTPAPEQYMDGTIELEFNDCTSGQITYNWGGSGDVPAASGVIPIQRLANDSVALCESLYAGPGMPGPL